MDAVSSYSFGNLGWLSLQAVPLIVWPRFIGNLLRPDDYQSAAATSLEDYFARSLGFALLTLGLLVVTLSGAVPLTSEDQVPHGTVSPYANAALVLSSAHHASAAFYCYSRWLRSGQTAFVLGCLGSAVFAVSGLWCLMFAGDKSRRSKRHGFDKDTSSFPFKNAESYRTKKKGM
ncbi:hypothetical protein Cob_v001002 [Colletotrichum orbiculare MAFF 240422]|uniref:Uncharacterized protein n=1 Tax=Colletotrichum orbiculare (strain 104-T / ATCC 96160 / CBS 514.97 / LARS 414 / MAFF 240422) TaxID=1213857 RepID=N4W171_COLOR|nr:hypothetical protein Cob_v001002 [Colletotrichum orbiculare MAFF 240422]